MSYLIRTKRFNGELQYHVYKRFDTIPYTMTRVATFKEHIKAYRHVQVLINKAVA